MEFKVTDIHDEIPAGWRLASISDVEDHMELVQGELCGMTFNICSLADGTVGGPGLGYQVTDAIDDTLDHKLIIIDPSTLSSEAALSDMKPDVTLDEPVSIHGHSSNEHTTSERSILNDKCPTEENVLQLNTNKILTQESNNIIETTQVIYSIESDIEITVNNIRTGDEKVQCDVIQSVNVDDVESNIFVNENSCGEKISNDPTLQLNLPPESKHIDQGSISGNEVSEETSLDTALKPNASDLQSNKSTGSTSPRTTKKKTKPMSASMQRLTAKKESPEKRSSDTSAAERKAKADELRKKKILEQRTKDDERRAAVLERRKKLEDAERLKKEALFKKLTTKESEKTGTRRSPMKGRHSLSTSNLSQLKKNKPVDLNTTTVPKRTENNPKSSLTERPKSAMQRPSMGYPPQKAKSFNAKDRKNVEVSKRPMSAFGSRTTPTKPVAKPSPRQSLNVTQPARPATALGISNVDKRKSLGTKQRNATTERPISASRKTLPKSKSASSVEVKSKDNKDEKQVVPSTTVDKKKSTEISRDKHKPAKPKNEKEKATGGKKELTKEEAKKALAERRKKAKEEAEEKAKIEREKDEVERLKREEEERRLAEQLKLEEERQAALLEQLKKEEDERKQKLMDEKEQHEREEKERLEEEQRQREEEIERKAKLELDKIQKEQERQELLLDQERVERKKRVEMIMARVSSKQTTGGTEDAEITSDTPPVITTPPEISTDPARLKVDDILRSRGFGRSIEDISTLHDKHDEGSVNVDIAHDQDNDTTEIKSEVVLGEVESNGDISATSHHTDDPDCEKIQSSDSVVDTNIENDDSVPLDESRLRDETLDSTEENVSPVSLEEAPSAEDISIESNADDDASTCINYELSQEIEEITLNNDVIDNVNVVSLNDTNNNKDFLIENRSSPINVWTSENILPTSQQLDLSEKIQNHTNHEEPIFMNGNQDKTGVINDSSNLHLTANLECEDNSVDMENNQWSKFDDRTKGGEEKLWKVLEGKVELSECF